MALHYCQKEEGVLSLEFVPDFTPNEEPCASCPESDQCDENMRRTALEAGQMILDPLPDPMENSDDAWAIGNPASTRD